MNSSPRFKLFLMMVLEIAIWGAWFPLIFGYLPSLNFSDKLPPEILKGFVSHLHPWIAALFSEQALILNAFPVAAIIGMFFSNQFADRNFAAENSSRSAISSAAWRSSAAASRRASGRSSR